jgi:uncharacterized DUF497 family protein
MVVIKLPSVLLFAWDKGNEQKNWLKHKVTSEEAEEVFDDDSRMLFEDIKHSNIQEKRFILFGKTQNTRKLVIVFTIRGEKARIISARPMNRKEAIIYEKAVSAA